MRQLRTTTSPCDREGTVKSILRSNIGLRAPAAKRRKTLFACACRKKEKNPICVRLPQKGENPICVQPHFRQSNTFRILLDAFLWYLLISLYIQPNQKP